MSELTATAPIHGPGRTDVRMMVVVHLTFRRELGLSPRAVRSTTAGDTDRAEQVAAHIELWLDLLHHHHSIEDEMLWGALAERVPDELEPLVGLMEEQHERVAALLDQAAPLLAAWRASALPADAARLADHLEVLVGALCEHLDAEESRVLPLMTRHITSEEWEAFTERGMEAIPKGMLLVGFGMMLYEGDPAAIALEIAKLPAPLRPVLPWLGRRAFRRYAKRIHGTATPPVAAMR